MICISKQSCDVHVKSPAGQTGFFSVTSNVHTSTSIYLFDTIDAIDTIKDDVTVLRMVIFTSFLFDVPLTVIVSSFSATLQV